MTLSFTILINGSPTFFVEKVAASFGKNSYDEALKEYYSKFPSYPRLHGGVKYPKEHSIREDIHDRWKPGTKLHFVINNRRKNRYQFLPLKEVISTQSIEIKEMVMTASEFCYQTSDLRVWIVEVDGKRLTKDQMTDLAHYDGFETLDMFFDWFSSNFKGKIIHWTNRRY